MAGSKGGSCGWCTTAGLDGQTSSKSLSRKNCSSPPLHNRLLRVCRLRGCKLCIYFLHRCYGKVATRRQKPYDFTVSLGQVRQASSTLLRLFFTIKVGKYTYVNIVQVVKWRLIVKLMQTWLFSFNYNILSKHRTDENTHFPPIFPQPSRYLEILPFWSLKTVCTIVLHSEL